MNVNDGCCAKREDAEILVQPDFERIYQKLSASISDVDFLTSEILASLSKFKEEGVIIKEAPSPPQKEPVGFIEILDDRVNYMKRVIEKLGMANSALKKLI